MNDKPLVSATFIPGGDSFGPGVGIPPLDDSKSSTYSRSDSNSQSQYSGYQSYHTPDSGSPYHYRPADHLDGASAQLNRSAHTTSYPFQDSQHPGTPGGAQSGSFRSQPPSEPHGGLNRHGTAMAGGVMAAAQDAQAQAQINLFNAQWPLPRVLHWLATNGFSSDWQDTFRVLNIQGADFIDLGRGASGRGNLGKMHQVVYPQLAKICSKSGTGWDQNREREEGKRMRKLVRQIAGAGVESGVPPHRRRESAQMLPSASTDGPIDNSPNLGRNDALTSSTAGGEGSPGKQMPVRLASGYGQSNSQRSSTVPIYGSSVSTPSETSHSESAQPHLRGDISRSILQALAPKGRHSPSASGDTTASSQLGAFGKPYEGSPKSGSPALSQAVPLSAGTHSKSNSYDSKTFTRAGVYAPGYGDSLRGGIGGAPGEVPMSTRQARPSMLESSRSSSHDKEHGKHFLPKFFRKKHDAAVPSPEDQALESPTSPAGTFKVPLRPGMNGSDMSLGERPESRVSERDRYPNARSSGGRDVTRKFIFATKDHWNYRLLDVTDMDNPEKLRQKLCYELGVAEPQHAQIYFTEAGQLEHENQITDLNQLLNYCSKADSVGSLKFFVSSPASSAISLPLPPSAGLGLSFPRSLPSPTATTSSRKPGDEDSLNKPQSAGHTEPGSPYLGSREPTLKASSQNKENKPSAVSDGTEVLQVDAALQKAAEEYKRENERKQRAYQESRLQRNGTNQTLSSATGIRGNSIIDFDSPRASPYEEKKAEPLVPFRKPPAAPSESSTLTKVNSLSRPSGGDRVNSDRKKKPVTSPTVGHGLGAALASVGRMAGTPAVAANIKSERSLKSIDFAQKGNSPTSSPSHTWSKGNMLFKVPDYEDQGSGNTPTIQDVPPLNLPPSEANDATPQATAAPTPSSSSRPPLSTRRSYGPTFDFQEQHVPFAPSPAPKADDSDDDSDDGLFAIPLANSKPSHSKHTGNEPERGKTDKPELSVDTKSHIKQHVSFRSPSTAGGGSNGPSSLTPDTEEINSSKAKGKADSDSWENTASPSTRTRRRASFASNVWADRPPVESVLDNLDDFFPDIDLDEPYLPEPTGNASSGGGIEDAPIEPMISSLRDRVSSFGLDGMPAGMSISLPKNESDTLGSDESTLKANRNTASSISSVAQRNLRKSGGLGRMKSIREVARDRNDPTRNKSSSAMNSNAAPSAAEPYNNKSGILRRKSTKMFGAHIVQIRPKSVLEPIPQDEIPTEDTPKRQATFRIIRGELIGKGTYGRVYLGMNATTGELLAVKQVEVNQKAQHQDKDRIKEMVAALDQEIDTMQHLEHSNIVQYLGCERKEFSISIYLEYISGGSVGSCLRKHGKFEESVVRSLTRQTLSGLAYLHGQGILHRDLKADNILLDRDGTCKISDFGISKKSDNIYGNDVTNSMQGSVFWMAPEVVRSQGQGYSAKVDIWSLGCVVLEMYAGRRPWSKEEAVGAIFKLGLLGQAPPIPDDVLNAASVDGVSFMYDCFQTDPSDRPTADTLLRHSTFCVPDPYYNWYDTKLAARLRPITLENKSD